jgi:hypothetical protein
MLILVLILIFLSAYFNDFKSRALLITMQITYNCIFIINIFNLTKKYLKKKKTIVNTIIFKIKKCIFLFLLINLLI